MGSIILNNCMLDYNKAVFRDMMEMMEMIYMMISRRYINSKYTHKYTHMITIKNEYLITCFNDKSKIKINIVSK